MDRLVKWSTAGTDFHMGMGQFTLEKPFFVHRAESLGFFWM